MDQTTRRHSALMKIASTSLVSLRQQPLTQNKSKKKLDSIKYLWQTFGHEQHHSSTGAGLNQPRHRFYPAINFR